jgi:tetratricopeptide (TPR) repeat protein
VAFGPDGRLILTGCDDYDARLWDAATGRPIGMPMEHSGWVYSASFSPDGRSILTGSGDTTARIWDSATGRPLGPPLEHPGGVTSVAFSPDGRSILTAYGDIAARLWDAATGQPIGGPMPHPSGRAGVQARVRVVAFSPDGRFLLTSGSDAARLWDSPAPLPDDLPRLAAWVQAATGLELDERSAIRVLDRAAWLERRRRLEQLGGPPPADSAPRLDPIVFGANPTARGDAWKERGQWDRAEDAYTEAAHARQLNPSIWEALARFYLERGRLGRAADTLLEAIRLMPDDQQLRVDLSRALLWAGDRAAWRRSNAALLDHFGATSNPKTANEVAWDCVLGPGGTADPEVPVRLAEAALKGADKYPKYTKANLLNTLGIALYRAGRFDETIRRIQEGMQLRDGEGLPLDWTFLAMAHHRLGHRDEALRWLDRLRNYQPSADPTKFWDELEIRLLRSEAEAVILYDPIFPADPFVD